MINETALNNGRVYESFNYIIRESITKILHKENIDDYVFFTGEKNQIYGMFIELSLTKNKISKEKLICEILKEASTLFSREGQYEFIIDMEERLICHGEVVTAILIEDFYALSERICRGLLDKRNSLVENSGNFAEYSPNEEIVPEIEMIKKIDEVLINWGKVAEVIDLMEGMEMDFY